MGDHALGHHQGDSPQAKPTRPFHVRGATATSRMRRVACSTPTTAGRPDPRAITAPWVIKPSTVVKGSNTSLFSDSR